MIWINQLRFGPVQSRVAQPHRYAINQAHARSPPVASMKTPAYFDVVRQRPDRSILEAAWVERAIRAPTRNSPGRWPNSALDPGSRDGKPVSSGYPIV
jgi:hypothetical protein